MSFDASKIRVAPDDRVCVKECPYLDASKDGRDARCKEFGKLFVKDEGDIAQELYVVHRSRSCLKAAGRFDEMGRRRS